MNTKIRMLPENEAVPAAAEIIRREGWHHGNEFAVGTALQLFNAGIVGLVTRESLESAALEMARYIICREEELPEDHRNVVKVLRLDQLQVDALGHIGDFHADDEQDALERIRKEIEPLRTSVKIAAKRKAAEEMLDGWTPWVGATFDFPRELNADTMIEAKLRNGSVSKRVASDFYWQWKANAPGEDVVSYRKIEPAEEGWTRWAGSTDSLPVGVEPTWMIEAKLRDGQTVRRRADDLRWRWFDNQLDDPGDVLSYRKLRS